MKLRKLLVALAVATMSVGLTAQAAWAHVHVTPSTAAAGSTVDLSFVVPNEREIDTTRVEVVFPDDHPVRTAIATSPAGWSSNADVSVGVVDKVVFDGGTIAPGQSASFGVTVTLPPDANQMIFKTLQTYSDGQVVRWIDEPSNTAAQHPAPVLNITGAVSTTATTAATTSSTSLVPSTNSDEQQDEDDSSLSAGQVFIGIGIALLIATGLRYLRKRRRTR